MVLKLRNLSQPSIDVALGMARPAQDLALIPPLCDGPGFKLPLFGRGDGRLGDRVALHGDPVRMAFEPCNPPGEQFAPILADRPIWALLNRDAGEPCGMTLVVKACIRSLFFVCHVCRATISKGNSAVLFLFGSQRIPAERALSFTPHVHSA